MTDTPMPSAPKAQAPSARRRRFYVPVQIEPGTRRMHIRRAVIPRQAAKLTSDWLAKMFAELREIADPMGPEMSRQRDMSETAALVTGGNKIRKRSRPSIIVRCAECNGRFEASPQAKFCGVKCRVRHWRV